MNGPLGRNESTGEKMKGARVVSLDGGDGNLQERGGRCGIQALLVAKPIDIPATRWHCLHNARYRPGEFSAVCVPLDFTSNTAL